MGFLLFFPGIEAAIYSHVGYFPGPGREEYDKYYDTLLRIVNIAFVPFVERMHFFSLSG